MFITAFTSAHHLSISCSTAIQSMSSTQILNILFNIILHIYSYVFQVVSYPQVSLSEPYMHIASPRILLLFILLPEKYLVRGTDH
jgi:hypothetical protein